METDVLSDRVWRRNDSYDNIAKDAFEPVLHVSNVEFFLNHDLALYYLHQSSLVQRLKRILMNGLDHDETFDKGKLGPVQKNSI